MAGTRRVPNVVTWPRVQLITDPTPDQIRRDLLLLQHQISDYNKPLQYSKQYIIEDVKNTFETETDPVDGTGWPALSERAIREPHIGILRRVKTNARMYRAFTNRNFYGVTKRGVYLNQQAALRQAPYAPIHQQDDRLPAAGISREAVIKEAKRLVGAGFASGERTQGARLNRIKLQAIENVKSERQFEGEGGGVPQRRFLGVSEYAKVQMRKTFDRWADDAIIIYKRAGRVVVRRR